MDYGPALAAVAFLMLGSYELAALRYAHPHPRRGLFCCLMSVYLGLLSLGTVWSPSGWPWRRPFSSAIWPGPWPC